MKNIHLTPTDKPSRLHKIGNELGLTDKPNSNFLAKQQNIYITSDEEIKEGDWFIANNGVHKCIRVDENTSCPFITLNSKGEEIGHFKTWRTKIILTTDQDLIKDGVQAIDDEFLEWFVKNPSCEEVEVELIDNFKKTNEVYVDAITVGNYYEIIKHNKIIIPKEEPKQEIDMSKYTIGIDPYDKQETLEEVAERIGNNFEDSTFKAGVIYGVIEGAKWQMERSYSLDEIKTAMKNGYGIKYFSEHTFLKNLNNLKKK